MKILLALVLGLVLTGTQANPLLDGQGAISGFEVDIKGQGYSLYDQRIAVLRALVNRKWVVIEQTASQVVAQYESKAKIAVDLADDTISVLEVQGGFITNQGWMKGLKKGIELELLYGRYMKDAMKFQK